MLIKDFNKFGDTSYRVKSQLIGFIKVLNIAKNFIYMDNKVNTFDDYFKDWAEENDIYNYNKSKNISENTKKIKRADIIISQAESMNIISNKNVSKISRKEIDDVLSKIKISPKGYFVNSILKNDNKNQKNSSFGEMVKYVLSSNKKELNLHTLALSFMVWDGKETFEDLMKLSKEDIITNLAHLFLKNIKFDKENLYNNLKEIKIFRKKIKQQDFIFELFKKKNNSIEISIDDVKKIENSTYLLKALEKLSNKKLSPNKDYFYIVNFLNNEVSCEKLFLEILKIKFEKLLLKDYLDLFLRWLSDFSLISTCSIKNKKLDVNNFKKHFDSEGKYIDNINGICQYPYTKQEIESFLHYISVLDYGFVNEIKYSEHISEINRATLAEYFVNLYFAQKLNIPPNEFKNVCKTIVDPVNLLPYSTAPGGQADFEYFDPKTKKAVLVETSILSTINQMKRNEIFSPIDHLDNIILKENDYSNKFVEYIICLKKIFLDDSFEKTFSLNFNEYWKDKWTKIIKEKPEYKILSFEKLINHF